MKPEDKLELIQKKLEKLSQKQLEFEKSHQQRIKSHEEQKTLYQHLFGQPPLQPDPELQSVKDEIARLDKREFEYMKVIQVNWNNVANFRMLLLFHLL